MRKRTDTLVNTILVNMNDQLETEIPDHLLAKLDHLAEFTCCIDMHQGKGWL